LHLHLRLAKFDYMVSHVSGKLLYVADALSRAPTYPVTPEDDSLQDDAEMLVDTKVADTIVAS